MLLDGNGLVCCQVSAHAEQHTGAPENNKKFVLNVLAMHGCPCFVLSERVKGNMERAHCSFNGGSLLQLERKHWLLSLILNNHEGKASWLVSQATQRAVHRAPQKCLGRGLSLLPTNPILSRVTRLAQYDICIIRYDKSDCVSL